MIKLGRVRFKVRDIQSNSYQNLQLRMKTKQDKFIEGNMRKSGSGRFKRKNSQEPTDTDLLHCEVMPNDNFIGVLPPAASNTETAKPTIIDEDTKMLVIRNPSATSNGVPLCRICLSED